MPPKPRQMRVEQRSALAAMQKLETRSDDELAADTRNRAAAQALLGARAAEQMDPQRARKHFKAAIAAARPQERLQLRRMAEASLALAERRAGDLKVAAERLGQPAPSSRQLLVLRFMGLIVPPPGAPLIRRVGGITLLIAIVVALVLLSVAIVQLIGLPFGGIGIGVSFFWGFLLLAVVLGVLVFVGRRRQAAARARAAERRANSGARAAG